MNIGLAFHGMYWMLLGYLILKSTFLPRMLAALPAIAGLGWLTFLPPRLARYLSPYNLALVLLLEGMLMLWLVTVGVNVHRWKK